MHGVSWLKEAAFARRRIRKLGGVLPLDSIGGLGGQVKVLASCGKERGQPVAAGDDFRRLAVEYRPLAR